MYTLQIFFPVNTCSCVSAFLRVDLCYFTHRNFMCLCWQIYQLSSLSWVTLLLSCLDLSIFSYGVYSFLNIKLHFLIFNPPGVYFGAMFQVTTFYQIVYHCHSTIYSIIHLIWKASIIYYTFYIYNWIWAFYFVPLSYFCSQ